MGVETLRLALTGIFANKLRSGLTILGMTIGVASVIVLIAVGNGSSKAVQASIEALGSNVLLVEAGFSFGGSAVSAVTAPVSLTIADANALQNKVEAPDVAGCGARRERQSDAGLRRHELLAEPVRRHDAGLRERARLRRRRPAASSAPATSPSTTASSCSGRRS